MTRSHLAALLGSTLLACGPGSPADETTAEDETSVTTAEGGETPPPEEDPMADPCAEGEGEPCAEGVDGARGGITEADAGAGTEEGATADGTEGTEGEETGGTEAPRVVWRNQVGAGRAVFDRICGVCHPDGEEDIGPDIRRRRIPVARVTALIRSGRGRMRPIPQRRLPDRYLDELMAYLSTIGTVSGVRRPQ
jgi:mono/diheme cytochrome c family protein